MVDCEYLKSTLAKTVDKYNSILDEIESKANLLKKSEIGEEIRMDSKKSEIQTLGEIINNSELFFDKSDNTPHEDDFGRSALELLTLIYKSLCDKASVKQMLDKASLIYANSHVSKYSIDIFADIDRQFSLRSAQVEKELDELETLVEEVREYIVRDISEMKSTVQDIIKLKNARVEDSKSQGNPKRSSLMFKKVHLIKRDSSNQIIRPKSSVPAIRRDRDDLQVESPIHVKPVII